jgi:hypothetical protein
MGDQELTALDRLEIAEVLARCARAHDTGDASQYALVFAPEAVLDLGEYGAFNGLEDVTKFLGGALVDFSYVQHRLSTSHVIPSETGARAETYFSARHQRAGVPGGDTFVLGGMYLDDFVRTASGWRILHRTVQPGWSEGNPSVIAEIPTGDEPAS